MSDQRNCLWAEIDKDTSYRRSFATWHGSAVLTPARLSAVIWQR
jgi:hypothetical protein